MINILLHSKLDDSGEVSLPAPLTAGLSISVSLATTMGTWLKWSNKPQIWDFCWNSWNNNALFPAGWLSQEKVSLECSHSSHRKEKDQETESESCRHGSLDQPVPTVPSLPGFFFWLHKTEKKNPLLLFKPVWVGSLSFTAPNFWLMHSSNATFSKKNFPSSPGKNGGS